MLHRNKWLFCSYTEKHFFRVTKTVYFGISFCDSNISIINLQLQSTSDRGFMYQIFPYQGIRSFWFDNGIENGCEKERDFHFQFTIVFHSFRDRDKKKGDFPFFRADKGKKGNVFFFFGSTYKKIYSGALDSVEVQINLTNEDKNKSHI